MKKVIILCSALVFDFLTFSDASAYNARREAAEIERELTTLISLVNGQEEKEAIVQRYSDMIKNVTNTKLINWMGSKDLVIVNGKVEFTKKFVRGKEQVTQPYPRRGDGCAQRILDEIRGDIVQRRAEQAAILRQQQGQRRERFHLPWNRQPENPEQPQPDAQLEQAQGQPQPGPAQGQPQPGPAQGQPQPGPAQRQPQPDAQPEQAQEQPQPGPAQRQPQPDAQPEQAQGQPQPENPGQPEQAAILRQQHAEAHGENSYDDYIRERIDQEYEGNQGQPQPDAQLEQAQGQPQPDAQPEQAQEQPQADAQPEPAQGQPQPEAQPEPAQGQPQAGDLPEPAQGQPQAGDLPEPAQGQPQPEAQPEPAQGQSQPENPGPPEDWGQHLSEAQRRAAWAAIQRQLEAERLRQQEEEARARAQREAEQRGQPQPDAQLEQAQGQPQPDAQLEQAQGQRQRQRRRFFHLPWSRQAGNPGQPEDQ